jgi:hypothetical protein
LSPHPALALGPADAIASGSTRCAATKVKRKDKCRSKNTATHLALHAFYSLICHQRLVLQSDELHLTGHPPPLQLAVLFTHRLDVVLQALDGGF